MTRPALVWGALCALTGVSVSLVEGGWLRAAAPIFIMLIAALKSRLVILQYMEARRAATHWRFLYETWSFTVTAMVIIGYAMSIEPVRAWFR